MLVNGIAAGAETWMYAVTCLAGFSSSSVLLSAVFTFFLRLVGFSGGSGLSSCFLLLRFVFFSIISGSTWIN